MSNELNVVFSAFSFSLFPCPYESKTQNALGFIAQLFRPGRLGPAAGKFQPEWFGVCARWVARGFSGRLGSNPEADMMMMGSVRAL